MSCQIFRSEFQSKIGKLIILHCEEGLHEVRFCSVESQQSAIQSSEECNSYRTDSSTNFIEWLDLYFNNANDVIHKTLPSICPNVLHSRGEFTTRVWRALIHHVPPGKTISYGHLASLCGNKKASCAVGTAMRVNPIPIFIPCHRVVKSDGKVGQYSGGSGMKEWLLEHEKALDVSNL